MKKRRLTDGFALIEAMIGMFVLAFGLVGVAKFQTVLATNSNLTKQRNEAVRLAEQKIEQFRSFELLPTTSGKFAYADIVTATDSQATTSTAYTRTATVTDSNAATASLYKTVQVAVAWTDRTNKAQSVTINSIIAKIDPKLSGQLINAPTGSSVRNPQNRNLFIPVPATDLGNGKSAYTPPGATGFYYVFSNTTGIVTARCTGDATTATVATLCADLLSGYIISGFISFSYKSNSKPDSVKPSDSPISLAVATSRTAGTGGTAVDECTNDSPPSAATYPGVTAYTCLIYPSASTGWSGTTLLSFPSASTSYKVCRYSFDYNQNGKIENIEHPAVYTQISQNLANENYLIISSSASCPTDSTIPTPTVKNYNTIQTQP